MSTDNNIPQVQAGMRKYVEDLQAEVDLMLDETVEAIKARMSVEGDPITYPVQWDSERQRRAFFATNGFGKGIPYQRRGGYVAAWTHERIPFGHRLSNPHPAGAIGGMPAGWQSRIHRGRWANLTQALFDELAKIPAKISNLIRVVSGK